jgi:GxxExxY protein
MNGHNGRKEKEIISFNRNDAKHATIAKGDISAGSKKPAEVEEIASRIIDAAFEVHRLLGPGLLESAYQACLMYELQGQNYRVDCQLPITFWYKGNEVSVGYRIDLLVEGCIIVENKAVEQIEAIHRSQLITYLKLTGCTLGFLINWNEVYLKHGLKRIVLGHPETPWPRVE